MDIKEVKIGMPLKTNKFFTKMGVAEGVLFDFREDFVDAPLIALSVRRNVLTKNTRTGRTWYLPPIVLSKREFEYPEDGTWV